MSDKRRYRDISDAQANAEALARRSTTYADPHARSWEVRFGTPSHELSTKALVARLMEALGDEVPQKLHEGPDHIDAGGVPAMTSAFLGYLDSGASSVVDPLTRQQRDDIAAGTADPPIIDGTYRKPLQAALDSMLNCKGKHEWWGRIAERVVMKSEVPKMAAIAEGSHPYEAERTVNEALAELYRRITPDRMTLPRRDAAA